MRFHSILVHFIVLDLTPSTEIRGLKAQPMVLSTTTYFINHFSKSICKLFANSPENLSKVVMEGGDGVLEHFLYTIIHTFHEQKY